VSDDAAPREVVQAAGGVLWRRSPEGELEVLLVHRPKYDDWSFPKGKLASGEDHRTAAVREVAEETGLECTVGSELASTEYEDSQGRPKVVRYWAMEPVRGEFRPNREVDEARWMPVAEAPRLLSYGHDAAVLASLDAPS
jgi:8-oxo-dGTP pyrophosphatase MutT (NUDIX family)